MKKLFYNLALFSFVSAFLLACSDDDEPSNSIVGRWQQTTGTISPPFEGVTDYFSLEEPCKQDDIIEFREDGTFIIEEGATKCDPDDSQILSTGNYQISGNILSTGNTSTTMFTLNGNTLLIVDDFVFQDTTYTETETYIRQ